MISANAKLTIQRIPLYLIQITQYEMRYPEKLRMYMELYKKFPDAYAGILHVMRSNAYLGMYELMDGHHKFCASIMTGRQDALCLVIEEPKGPHGNEQNDNTHKETTRERYQLD